MRAYQPPALSDSASDAEKTAPASTSVAPLVQFFELVHIGDMIQSIVQVYFNKELVCYAFPPLPLSMFNQSDCDAIGPPRRSDGFSEPSC
jgi:hypothetical protein